MHTKSLQQCFSPCYATPLGTSNLLLLPHHRNCCPYRLPHVQLAVQSHARRAVHDTHVPLALYDAQAVQADANPGAVVPAGHGTHAAAVGPSAYVLGGHGAHADAPKPLDDPAAAA